MEISAELSPANTEIEIICKGLTRFNQEACSEDKHSKTSIDLAVFVRSEEGEVIGGLTASCSCGNLRLEEMWLPEHARGNGIGKRVLTKAEQLAVENGCVQSVVSTTSFQARPFYEANGYQLVGTIDDLPVGHATFFLVKRLD
ncbi:GNAT family N-acetyltransferase [Corallincola platygyrae]